MKIAVIGSRTLTVRNLEKYIPKDTTITYCFRHSKVMRTNKNASEPCSGDRCNSFIILFYFFQKLYHRKPHRNYGIENKDRADSAGQA